MLWGRIQWPFLNSGIILNHLAISFSSELILHLHGSGDGGGVIYNCSKTVTNDSYITVIYNCYITVKWLSYNCYKTVIYDSYITVI